MSTFYAFYPPSGAGSSASVGVNGAPAPTSSTEVGGINPGGNLQPLQTDASGNLLVSLAAEPLSPFNVNLDKVGNVAITLGQKAATASLPVVAPSNGATGAAVPTNATFVGIRDIASGNLAPLLATAAGYLGVQDLAAEASLSNIDTHASNIDTATAGINTKTPALGQAAMAASSPVAIASDQSAIPVTVASLPLPSGGSTAALQSNVQSAPGTPQSIALTVQGNASGVAVPVSAAALPLPTGASTLTAQNTGNASLSSIDGKLGSLGQKNMAGSAPVVIASDQASFPVTVAAGSAIIGKVSIDQTTPGTTNGVQVNAALPAGSNVIGHVISDSGSTTAVTQATAANLNATVVQGTAANLKASVNLNDGSGSAVNKGQTTMSGSLPVTLASDQSALSVAQKGLASSNAPIQNIYSSVNVTTSAYVQLIASTTSATTFIDIFDSSGQAMILATGGAGSEVIQAYIPPGGDSFAFAIPAGTRVAIKALTATANSGYLLLNLRG